MLTLNLSITESINYVMMRGKIRADAKRMAAARGKRFAQVVAADGRIVDVLETQ